MSKSRRLKILRKKLDGLFSYYIKLRDTDHNGVGRCSTCGRELSLDMGRRVNAGHFFPYKRSSFLRYNEFNVHLQCASCNMNQGEQYLMGLYILNKYGHRVMRRLLMLKEKKFSYEESKYKKLIRRYERKVEKYYKEKNI